MTKKEILFFIFFLGSLAWAQTYSSLSFSDPSKWELSNGLGKWKKDSITEKNCPTLTGSGKAKEINYWKHPFVFLPNQTFRISGAIRTENIHRRGNVILGTDSVRRDLWSNDEWQNQSFVFQTPRQIQSGYIFLGQWEVGGTAWFQVPKIERVQPVHSQQQGFVLGSGEEIKNRTYQFHSNYKGEFSNFSRPLLTYQASFNSDRFVLESGNDVLYKHEVGQNPSLQQLSGKIKINVGYYEKGKCILEVSQNLQRWLKVGEIEGKAFKTLNLPSSIFPSNPVYVRFRAEGSSALFQIFDYSYESTLSKDVPLIEGETTFGDKKDKNIKTALSGKLLKTSLKDLTLWWTHGTQKIRPETHPPSQDFSSSVSLSASRNEYEPAILVFRSQKEIKPISVSISSFLHETKNQKPAPYAKLFTLDYVPISFPSDSLGKKGLWPDPLPPLTGPLNLSPNKNLLLWVLVYVPPKALPGNYSSSIEIRGSGWKSQIPLKLKVWDFSLPKETHLQSAFGFSPEVIRKYHHYGKTENLEPLLDKYYQNFSEHRLAPFSSFPMEKIKTSVDPVRSSVKLDFRSFDEAAKKSIQNFGFNSYRIEPQGLGAGTFYDRRTGEFGGFRQGHPTYEKLLKGYLSQLEKHFSSLGLLKNSYLYWFDEPVEKDFAFVKETMKRIHTAAPNFTRMLTIEPRPELFGSVDLWCPQTPNYNHSLAEKRRALGEKFWWYICSNPKTPYATLFIDHPAVDLRTWIWQSWKYNIEGILIWQSHYWTSDAAYPPPSLQNPYEDPMSYVSGYGKIAGQREHWGNGDGRFLYPPKSVFQSSKKCTDGPVSSFRLEMLREGMEDYEYLGLLRDLISKAEKSKKSPAVIRKAKSLLLVPETITQSLTAFSKDPQFIFQHRQKLAEMILELQKL